MSYTKTTWVNNTTPINETNLNKIESGIKNNDINIGEENYDNTKTYEVGDIVRYNEKIYKCITAITTAENFDISKWEQTNIVEIVQSEKSKIYELIEAISTPIVGEGENITLNDTAEKRFENFDIEGNSEQEATPSPDYPSEVKSVGDDVNELNPIAGGSQGINSSVIEGKISFSGTANTTFANITSITVGVIKKGTYIFSINEAKNYSVRLRMYYTESEYIDAIIPENKKEVVIELTNDVIKYYTYIYPLTAGTNYNDFIYEKLQKGTTATPYSPYGQGCINEVICNKNLFDKNTTTDGKYIGDNGSIQTQSNIMYSDYIQIKTNINYYITGRSEWASVALYDKNKTFLERISTTQPNGVLNITNSNCKYIIINALLTDKDTLQIEEGSTATPYEEHQSQSYTIPTQQPMRSIGDVRDCFVKKSDGWYERHYIGEVVLDGSRMWNKSDTYSNETYFCGYLNTAVTNIIAESFSLNNSFQIGKYMSVLDKECMGNNVQLNVRILASRLTENSANGFKQWLSTHNVKAYGRYVTPLDLPCTEEQSTILWDIEQNAKTYKGVTHIYSNDEVSPNCYVEAVKDLTTLIQ